MNFQLPAERTKTQPPPVDNHIIPDELLVSLTSTVCSRSTLGHTAHNRHCKGCGIRRPDAVWHHPMGRKKYKFFLEQPTSLTGAGRDISFLCDAMVAHRKTTPLPPLTERSANGDTQNYSVSESVIPEEYHIVKNKGLRSLEFFEDAFTVQLQDDEQKLRVFPSLAMTCLQMEGLLELVQVEQNIYNIVFHELIRQVSVGCAERGQLLAKLRQRYQTLLQRIPSRLKALHTEAVAQRALDRRLTEEIHRIKRSIQQLNVELSRIRDHDDSVSQQAECAHQQLAGALEQTNINSELCGPGLHELYDLQRGRLEAQLLQMTEERDCWSQITFCLALKVISVKKLQLISRLHIMEQSWFKTAEHCSLNIALKDTEEMNAIMKLSDYWKEQLTVFMSQLKNTEHAQCEQISAIQQGIAKCLDFCATKNKFPDLQYEKASLEKIHADVKQWAILLSLQCDRYQGEKLLCCQQTLGELGSVQERWLTMSLELLRRHLSPDGEPSEGQQALRELDRVLSELLKQLDSRVSGESGIHGQMMSLLGFMESRISKLGVLIGRSEMMSASDWQKLESSLRSWQSLTKKIFQNVHSIQTENEKDKNEPDYKTDNVSDKVKEFIISVSNFADAENHRISEEVHSIHMAQTRWMLDFMLLIVPDHSEGHSQEQEHHYITTISLQTLVEDAKTLAEKLDVSSAYISSSCKLILEEQTLQNPYRVDGDNEMSECRKLQRECTDWVETCRTLLSRLTGGPVELPVRQADPASSSNVPLSPADSTESL
ncbi:hypothetical protein F7725_027864, partial [Dissostichus mawsoni]